MHFFIALFKWLFTLEELAWFLTGGLMFSSLTYINFKLKEKGNFGKLGYTFVIFSVFWFVFAILWALSSYLENEVQAANMGIVVFGLLGVIFLAVGNRLISKGNKAVGNSILKAIYSVINIFIKGINLIPGVELKTIEK